MWLFNLNSINNLLLFILTAAMVIYFIARSRKNREDIFLIIFMFQLVLWQLFFLFRNLYFDPLGAYPLYYFLNSGYTVFSYMALVMFSYHVVTPVFKREAAFVFYSGLAASLGFLIYAAVFVFSGEVQVKLNPVLHVYEAEPAPHRAIMLYILLAYIILTAKNLIYKIIIYRAEHRVFIMNTTFALITGVFAVVGVAFIDQYYPINPDIHNTINTYISGFLFIYFYLNYLSYSRIPFYYSDKAVLLILFIIIIVSSMTTALTFSVYNRVYIVNKQSLIERIAEAMSLSRQSTFEEATFKKRLNYLYSDDFVYLIKKEESGESTVYIGSHDTVLKTPPDGSAEDFEVTIHTEGKPYYYNFRKRINDITLHAGFTYLNYRQYVHEFVSAAFFTVTAIMGILFVFMNLVVFTGLTRPLKRLMAGVKEVRSGNLNHRIENTASDEIGYISDQYNLMVEDLKTSGEVIRRSEQKFRELTGMLPDIVYETDLNLNITYMNRAGFIIAGYTDYDIKKGLSLYHILDNEEFTRLHLMISGEKSGKFSGLTTHKVRKKNGETILAENNAAVIYDDKNPVGIRGVIRDVTEKVRIENTLVQAQKMETIGSLAGGIAHDFNNILTGITGTVSLLEYKAGQPGGLQNAEVRSDLETLKKSSNRAADMIKQLLAISRHSRPDLEEIDLNRVASGVYGICKNSFDKKIELNFEYCERDAYVMADETQMGQVLLNLCVNARDAMTIMRPGGADHQGVLNVIIEKINVDQGLSALFSEAPAGLYCRMRVTDTGVGIKSDITSRIFDPFFTTKKKDEGTGLGLSMVYNIVKQHNGFIDILSDGGTGTTVDVFIPCSGSHERIQKTEAAPVIKESKGVVLLVDDDPIVRKTCEKMLNAIGCECISAGDGREGVELFRNRRDTISAVILDLVMPVMSGNEAFDELKKIDPGVKVLVSSGFRDDSRIDEIMIKGAAGFVQKPYTLESLSDAVFSLLNDDRCQTR